MQTPPPPSSLIGIKHWPTWIGIFFLFVLAWMPFSFRLRAGEFLGLLTYWFAKERRYITSINIALCFPELNEEQQNNLVKKTFKENGVGLIETTTGWVRKPESFKNQITLIGLEELETAQAKGKGVLLIGAHFTALDFAANLTSLFHPFGVTYRTHGNALFDNFMLRGRLANFNGVFDRNDIRSAFRHLKQGKTLWYGPDQDYGPEHAVFAPFFGNKAATITTSSRFAAFNQSPVFLLREHRINRSNQYEIEFIPFPENFPSTDDVRDAALLNSILEKAIRLYPAQYLWMHKRFKTQPGGKPESPYIDIETPNHVLTEKQYRHMMEGAELLSELDQISDYKLSNGLKLKQYPGIIGKRFYNHHAGKIFDRHAKDLRMHGINSVTADNFFRIPRLNISAVTYFAPPGKMLSEIPDLQLPLQDLAIFLAQLHREKFFCPDPAPDMFAYDTSAFSILDPSYFSRQKSPISTEQRKTAITSLTNNLNLGKSDRENFFIQYTEAAEIADTPWTHL